MRNQLKTAGYILGAFLTTFLTFGISIAALSGGTVTGVAKAAATALAEGAAASFSFDLNNNARVTLGTCLSGESACVATSSDSYIMTRTDLLASTQKSADAQIKASAGYVGNLICTGDASAAAAGTIIVYDSLTETGTVLYTLNITLALDYHLPMTIPINTSAATGIYLGYTTVSDVNCTVFYR